MPSFRDVYEAHFDFVWRNVANRGVPPAAIDDVLQEVFIVVHNRLATFEGRSSLRTWIAGIIRNVVRDHLRTRRNMPAGEPLEPEAAPAAEGSPADILDRKAAVAVLDGMLEQMTELQREVFILCDIEGMTAPEVAGALGVNENTLRTRLRAAREVFEAGVARLRAREG